MQQGHYELLLVVVLLTSLLGGGESSALIAVAALALDRRAFCCSTQSGRAGSEGCDGGVPLLVGSVGEWLEEDDDETRRLMSELRLDDALPSDACPFILLSSIPAAETLLPSECLAVFDAEPPLLLLLELLPPPFIGLLGSNRERSA